MRITERPSNALCGQQASPPSPTIPPLIGALETCEGSQKELVGVLGSFLQSLHPILQADTPKEQKPFPGQDSPMVSPVVDRLKTMNGINRGLIATIREIQERIDL